MNLEHVPTQASVNAERHGEGETRLQGRILRVAQAAWILVAVLAFILFVVSLPTFYTQIQSVCTGSACNGVQVSPEQAQALAAHGISLANYAWYSILVTALQAVTQGATTSIAALQSFPVLQYPVLRDN